MLVLDQQVFPLLTINWELPLQTCPDPAGSTQAKMPFLPLAMSPDMGGVLVSCMGPTVTAQGIAGAHDTMVFLHLSYCSSLVQCKQKGK